MNIYPLTDFEEYMFIDDRPSYPMDSFCRLTFSRKLDPTILQEALVFISCRHPFLRCGLIRSGLGHAWQEHAIAPDFIQATPEPGETFETGYSFIHRLDLSVSGARFYLVDFDGDNPHSELVIQLHHTLSDGLGALGMIYDLLTFYATRSGHLPEDQILEELHPELLFRRGKYGLTPRRYFRNFFDTSITTKQHLRLPVPMFKAKPIPDEEITNYPTCRILELDPLQTKNYFEKAKRNGATVNDLLIRDTFLAIENWRKRRGLSLCGWNRIMMPINMRCPEHRGIPMANMVSSVFIDRSDRDLLSSPTELLRSIHQETDWIKRSDQAFVFLMGLRIFRTMHGSIYYLSRRHYCGSTGVMTNLGTGADRFPFPRNEEGRYYFGDLILTDFDAVCPIRPLTQTAFCALTYANRLKLCLRYDHRLMTSQDANDFMTETRDVLSSPE